jgi:hypothetical protein
MLAREGNRYWLALGVKIAVRAQSVDRHACCNGRNCVVQTRLIFCLGELAEPNKRRPILRIAVFILLALGLIGSASAWAFDAKNAKLVDKGFKLFTQETFKGNGRTCETCHLPQHDYGLAPSDLASMNAHQRNLVLATRNPNLENPIAVNKLTAFNIANGPPGNVNNPEGPLRTSIPIGGLAFTTSNSCSNSGVISSITGDGATATVTTTEPMELVVGETFVITGDSIDEFNVTTTVSGLVAPDTASGVLSTTQFTFASATSGTGSGGQVIAAVPCPGAAINRDPAVDDGRRNVQLGWGGNGFPIDSSIFPNISASANCIAAVDASAADPTNLTLALGAFDIGAVRTHFTRSLNRIPGADFRCPTPDELDAMATFLKYLGRQFELALCSNSAPSAICTGAQFSATQFATGRNGTQTPFSSSVITFNDDTAETGKAIFLDSRASCNLCHFNGGAQSTEGDIRGEPALAPEQVVSPVNVLAVWQPDQSYIPAFGSPNNSRWSVVTATDSSNPYFFLAANSSVGPVGNSGDTEPAWPTEIGGAVVDNEITWINLGIASKRGMGSPSRNFSGASDTDVLKNAGDPLASFSGPNGSLPLQQVLAPVVDPQDTGDAVMNTGPAEENNGSQGGFNFQSVIEAARKSSFFHAGAIFSNVEDAASFYFTSIFEGSGIGGPITVASAPRGRGCSAGVITGNTGTDVRGCGAAALNSLAGTYTGGDTQQVLNHIGFFLRALSTVYSIADCERLVNDSINRIDAGLPIKVPVLNCTSDLGDVDRVIAGAHVTVPDNYLAVQAQAQNISVQLNKAAKHRNRKKLAGIINQLKSMRHSIASISPDLPI